jgi:hypothetical protein
MGPGTDGPVVAPRELLQAVDGSGGGLKAGVDLRHDQLNLLGREGLPGHLQGWTEGTGGKTGIPSTRSSSRLAG